MITYFEKLVSYPGRTLPIIIDERGALECISAFSGRAVTDLDECHTGMISGVYLIEKEEDKQSLSIRQIRESLGLMSEKPYTGKHLFIYRDFDSSSIEAMNASLKFLEEPPEYAIILLVVSNPENLLETIRSRTISFFRAEGYLPIGEKWETAIEKYRNGSVGDLVRLLSREKLESGEAIQILMKLSKNAKQQMLINIERGLIDLMTVNESPRNIFDRILLGDA